MDKQNIKGAKKINSRKVDTVTQLSDKFKKAKSVFLADYRGLTHQQLETLKKSLKKLEAEFLVAKNTLLKIAIKQSGAETMKQLSNETIEQLNNSLKNPTAAFFAYEDEIAPIKELSKFIKNIQLPKIKLGIFAGKTVSEADFQKLASLPTREELLATLAMRLKSPIYGLHYALNWNLVKLVTVLNNVKSKKPVV